MKNVVLVSIVVPTFNSSAHIEETLKSLEDQHYPNWEAILVDDGSNDSTLEILKNSSASDQRIKVFNRNIDPKGASTCRNIGIQNAQGNFIVFLDADDLLAPYCLQQRVEKMEHHKSLDFGVFRMQWFDNTLANLGNEVNKDTDEDPLRGFLSHKLPWTITGPIWRKEALQRLGGFNTSYHRLQDVELHTRALLEDAKYKVFSTVAIDCYYRKPTATSGKRSKEFCVLQLTSFQAFLLEFGQRLNRQPLKTNYLARGLRMTLMKAISYAILYVNQQVLSTSEGIAYKDTLLDTALKTGVITPTDSLVISLYYQGKVKEIPGASRLLNPILSYRRLK